MSTDVNLFLPKPASPAYLREAYPYGPSSSGFHTGLAIEIDPSQLAQNRVIAVVSGMARLVLDPLSPQTCTLVLIPNYSTMNDLSQVTGKNVVVFVYRNLAKPNLPTSTIPPSEDTWPTVPLDGYCNKITLLNIPSLPPPAQLQQLGQFLNGEISVDVNAGDKLLLPSTTGGVNNWGRLGFEIVFVPSGLWGDVGWNRLKELIDPGALTRRLDPMSFYARVKAAPLPLNLVADPAHALFTVTTRRILLELRDEYDQPFNGTAYVYDGGNTTPFVFDGAHRGTVELPATTTFSSIEIPDYVSTELPSGDAAEVPAVRNFTGPDHWALQFIYMPQNPASVDDVGWFVSNLAPLPRYTENNKITPIRDGVNVFRQYAEAIGTLTQPGHFMCLAGWWLDSTFPLVAGDPGSTMAQLMTVATANPQNAKVRALLWNQSQNSGEVSNINNLNGGNGHAILDDYTHDCLTINAIKTGTHHQKLLVVYGSQGEEIAFCGGVDINKNRCDSERHGAVGGFHDVHAKVEGPAVADIFQTFAQRWNSHPANNTGIITGGTNFKPNAGSIFTQVARTYPLLGGNPVTPAKPYPFAPEGCTTPLQAFLRAIQKAKKFIYIEDQYLTPYREEFHTTNRRMMSAS